MTSSFIFFEAPKDSARLIAWNLNCLEVVLFLELVPPFVVTTKLGELIFFWASRHGLEIDIGLPVRQHKHYVIQLLLGTAPQTSVCIIFVPSIHRYGWKCARHEKTPMLLYHLLE